MRKPRLVLSGAAVLAAGTLTIGVPSTVSAATAFRPADGRSAGADQPSGTIPGAAPVQASPVLLMNAAVLQVRRPPAAGMVVTQPPAAGVPAQAPVASPRYPMHTLTVTATNGAGKPDTGDTVVVFDGADLEAFGLNFNESCSKFYHGVAKFSVPTGSYWVIGSFGNSAATTFWADIHPQVPVARNTVVHLAQSAATSKVTMVTPRPTTAGKPGRTRLYAPGAAETSRSRSARKAAAS